MSRQRDVFPLQHFPETVLDHTRLLSRSVQRRLLRRGHRCRWMNQTIDTLNDLNGPRMLDPGLESSPPLGSRIACEYVASCFSGISHGVDPILSDGALEELLAKSGAYNQTRSDILPYDKSLVAWPPTGSSPCALSEGLDDESSFMLSNWQSTMLKPIENDSESNSTYNPTCKPPHLTPVRDRALFSSPKVYADFSFRLHEATC